MSLRALTLIRPMSAAIVHGTKRIENRPQNLPKAMRGVQTIVAVHAGKRVDDGYVSAIQRIDGHPCGMGHGCTKCRPTYAERFDDQGIVGLMLLSGRVVLAQHNGVGLLEGKQFRDPWFFGPFGYEIAAAIAFPGPIPCAGALGFWRVPAELERQISDSGAYDDLMDRAKRAA